MVIMVFPLASFAEVTGDYVLDGCDLQFSNEVLPTGTTPLYSKHAYSSCYVPVTYKTVSGSVVTNEVTYYEKVADISYLYYIAINSEDECTGGYIVSTSGWPKVTAVSDSHLGLTIVKSEGPTGSVVPVNNGASYTVNIYGGCLTITYNAVIYKDINNQTIGTESSTVTRAYSYTETLATER